jgi:hypothetical protein
VKNKAKKKYFRKEYEVSLWKIKEKCVREDCKLQKREGNYDRE